MAGTGTLDEAAARSRDGSVVPLLEARNIVKIFGATTANDDVSEGNARRDPDALLGENGAGKSTLVKMLYGALRPTEATSSWQGEPVTIGSRRRRGRSASAWCSSTSRCSRR